LGRVARDEVVNKEQDVLRAPTQGRQVHRKDVQPVVEILAKLPFGHRFAQVPVGRGNDADIDRYSLASAHPLQLVLLEDTQELDLHLGWHLADLVQKDRPAVGELKAAEAFLGRARERALLMPEEFALDQASRQGGTGHLDEW